MARRDDGLVRIVFELDASKWHGNARERLWAEPVGSGRYRLRNTPFFAFGVSFEDIVFSEERDGEIFFAGTSIAGGHSTYRLMLLVKRTDDSFLKYWQPLQSLGCTFEEGIVLAVDVPPSTDVHEAYRLLDAGEVAGIWSFEEGHCGHHVDSR